MWTWRCRGAIFYSTCIAVTALLSWDLLTAPLLPANVPRASLSQWFASLLALCSLQPLMIVANARALLPCDVFTLPPLLHLGSKATGPALVPIARLLARFCSMNKAKNSLVLLLAYAVAGGAFTTIHTIKRLGSSATPFGELLTLILADGESEIDDQLQARF